MDFFDSLEAAARPHVERKPWMKNCTMTLVSEATITAVIDECIAAGEYGLDLETTGLDNRVFNGRTVDRIVGVCLSPNGVKGYYIPILHINHPDKCVSTTVAHRELRRLTSSNARALFHNAKFDQEFLQFNGWGEPLGEWDKPTSWDCTLILSYLRNTRERNKGLKHLSKVELNMEMIELDELFTADELKKHGKNFSVLDPEWGPTLWYACSDAICTYRLKQKLHPEAIDPRDGLPSQMPLYRIEKLCVAATRWMERLRVPIDRDKVAELIRLGQREWFPALGDVYSEASKALGRDITPGYFRILETDPKLRFDTDIVVPGIMDRVDVARTAADQRKIDPVEFDGKGGVRVKSIRKRVPGIIDKKVAQDVEFPLVYDVLKPEELGLLLRELGVSGLKATEKSGQIQTSADELDRVVEEAGEDFPFIAKVKRFREVAKAISTNLMPLYEYTDLSRSPDSRVKVNFEAFKVDTGRFSTPGREGKAGFTGTIPWNLQSVPAGYDPRRPECSTRLRECIRVQKGRILFAIDYSGEELRVVTNLSGEPLWVTEFFRCSGCDHQFDRGATIPPPPDPPPPFCPKCGSDKIGDLHTLTALAVYGEGIKADKEMFKQRRKEAKAVNFGLCYGGGGSAVQRATGCAKEEGWRIKRQFDKTYNTLFAWWKTQHEYARKTKHVLTAFNRRYPLPDIDSADDGFRAKAERNAVNGPVQGTGADIMKFAMGLIYLECKRRGWLNRVRMIITIHDELVFEIDEDLVAEALPVIKYLMLRKVIEKMPWRVPLTCDIEAGYDWTVPWNITEMEFGKKKVAPEIAHVVAALIAARTSTGSPNETAPMAPTAPTAPTAPIEATAPTPTAPPAPTETTAPTAPIEATAPPTSMAAPLNPIPSEAPVQSPAPGSSPLPVAPVTIEAGEIYTHSIRSAMFSMKLAARIARVIAECEGRGVNPLRIVDEHGTVLWYDPTIRVNPTEFAVLINRRGDA